MTDAELYDAQTAARVLMADAAEVDQLRAEVRRMSKAMDDAAMSVAWNVDRLYAQRTDGASPWLLGEVIGSLVQVRNDLRKNAIPKERP